MQPTAIPSRATIHLTGPTCSGKSAVAIVLARLLDAEILSMDSMTLYRGMDIGTAKPTRAERASVPHHLIDVIDPWESADVARYCEWAMAAEREVHSRGRKVLYAGGTPLYLKSLLRGLFGGPAADASIRMRLGEEVRQLGMPALRERLMSVDPAAAGRIAEQDERRLIRALEVYELTGRPLSDFQVEHAHPAVGRLVFAIQPPRDELRGRIDERTVAMFESGLVEEADRLRGHVNGLHAVPAQAVGYRESLAYLDGRMTRRQAVERTQARTRQVAKRQMTWFRGLEEITGFPVGHRETVEEIALRLFAEISRPSPS